MRDADPGLMHWVFTRRDVTERWLAHTEMLRLQLLEARLASAAYRDDLTGLPNRALFLTRLRAAVADCARSRRAAPGGAVLDIDRFKLVNDNFGHLAGDRLLAAALGAPARALRRGVPTRWRASAVTSSWCCSTGSRTRSTPRCWASASSTG